MLIAGIARIFLGNDVSAHLNETTLLYFVAAAGLFLATQAKSLKFGDFAMEMQQMKEDVKEAKLLAGIAQDSAKLETAPPPQLADAAMDVVPGNALDDPWKGVFGGKSIDTAAGRLLSANVEELKNLPGWFSIALRVTSLPGSQALTGRVRFFLHDSFPNSKPWVDAVEGVATLQIKAWGAFTVGVLADGGATRLELDLAELESAPILFRSR